MTLAVLRLVGGRSEGTWLNADELRRQPPIVARQWRQPHQFNPEDPFDVVPLVPTGTIEWLTDDGPWAEVWVPADRLDYWRVEHGVVEP